MRRLLTCCAIGLVSLAGTARGEVLSFTVPVVADYEFNILGGTPINPGPETGFLPFRAVGDLTFTLDSSLNDPSNPTSVPFTNMQGVLTGVPPSPPFVLPHTISPNVMFLGGSLTNIVRDAGGEVISADVVDLTAEWELLGPGGLRIYTRGGLPFSATGVTIPFALGTVLSDHADFNGYLDDGDGDPTNDRVVVIGRNRDLTVVPEPASFVLTGVGAVGLIVTLGRRSRRTSRTA